MRLFIGPTGVGKIDFSNYSYRTDIQQINIENGLLNMESKGLPLIKLVKIDLTKPLPPPSIKCEKVGLDKFKPIFKN